MAVEYPTGCAYRLPMNKTRAPAAAPTEWLEVIAESEADIAADRIVPGEVVLQMLRDSLARLEARTAAKSARKARKKEFYASKSR
jgi:hypothetical protein